MTRQRAGAGIYGRLDQRRDRSCAIELKIGTIMNSVNRWT